MLAPVRARVMNPLSAFLACIASSCATFPAGKKGPETAAVVVLTDVGETRGALLEGRPFRAIDVTDAYLLLTSDNVVNMLDVEAPESWPSSVRRAWQFGADACRERGVRPPWDESEDATRCANDLGPAILNQLARAQGATLLIIVDDDVGLEADHQPLRVVAFRPNIHDEPIDDGRFVTGARMNVTSLIDEVWAGGGRRVKQPSIAEVAGVQNVTSTPGFQPFDAIALAGCVRPLPVSLEVSPADVGMSNMIEHAWSRLSPSVRTGPATTCVVRAIQSYDGGSGKRTIAGTLTCEGLGTSKKTLARSSSLESDVADMAKELIDQVAFDACKYR
jgi:hypothetical protein